MIMKWPYMVPGLLGTFLLISQTEANEHTDAVKLYNKLFEGDHYHKELRPIHDLTKPVNVSLQLWFKQILKVDEVDQILSVYCWIEEYWRDEYLTWNPKDYGGTKELLIPHERIWRPDILVYNNANMHVKDNTHATNIQVNATGHISMFRAVITDIACMLDMTYFPFDQQVCFVMFASWSYDGGKLDLYPLQVSNSTQFYIENTEWVLKDFKYRRNLKKYECCPNPYPDLVYYFVMERNPSYYILSLIIPSAFIVIVTIVGFFIPHSSSGENTEKVSLGVTALLSLAIILLMVADKMPATSKVIPLIGKYYIGLIFLIFLATISTTLTLNLQLRGNSGVAIRPDIRHFFFERLAPTFYIRVNLVSYKKNHPMQNNKAESETTFLLNSQYNAVDEYTRQSSVELNSVDSGRKRSRRSGSTNENGNSGDRDSCLEEISSTTKSIRADFLEQLRLDTVRKEWEQLARIIERIMMMFYIAITILMAWWILSTRGPPIQLTDTLMKSAND